MSRWLSEGERPAGDCGPSKMLLLTRTEGMTAQKAVMLFCILPHLFIQDLEKQIAFIACGADFKWTFQIQSQLAANT